MSTWFGGEISAFAHIDDKLVDLKQDLVSGHAASETELRVMSRVVVLGALAGRLAAAAHDRGKGAGSQITQAEELLQQLGSFGLQSSDIIRHKGFLSVPQIVCTYIDVQNNATKKGIPQRGTCMSPTRVLVCY